MLARSLRDWARKAGGGVSFLDFLPNPFAFESQFAKSGILRIEDGTFLR